MRLIGVLWTLAVWLVLPLTAEAASANTSCNALFAGSPLVGGGGAQCIYMCNTIASATTTNCPVVKVPFGRVKHVEVRVYNPSTTNCAFDDGLVLGLMSSTESVTGGHRLVYGVLDDDSPAVAPGNTVGVAIPFPTDPFMAVAGIVTTGASCDGTGTNVLDVIGLFWEDTGPN